MFWMGKWVSCFPFLVNKTHTLELLLGHDRLNGKILTICVFKDTPRLYVWVTWGTRPGKCRIISSWSLHDVINKTFLSIASEKSKDRWATRERGWKVEQVESSAGILHELERPAVWKRFYQKTLAILFSKSLFKAFIYVDSPLSRWNFKNWSCVFRFIWSF